VLLTSAVDVGSVRKFPVEVYGLVLYLCWLGNVFNGLGDGAVVGFQWSIFKRVSKIALGCTVLGSLK